MEGDFGGEFAKHGGLIEAEGVKEKGRRESLDCAYGAVCRA